MSLIILGSSWSRELAPHLEAHPTLHPAIPLGVCIKPYSFRLHESLKKGLGDLEVEAACSFPGQSPTTVTSFPCQPTLNWSLLCHNQKPSEIFPKQKNNALPGERKKVPLAAPKGLEAITLALAGLLGDNPYANRWAAGKEEVLRTS